MRHPITGFTKIDRLTLHEASFDDLLVEDWQIWELARRIG